MKQRSRKKLSKSLKSSNNFAILVWKTVIGDSKLVVQRLLPKQPILAEGIKILLLLTLFLLPFLLIIPFQSASTSSNSNSHNDDNSGKAVPNPHPQPQSEDQAFFISFSTTFDLLQPVKVSYPVTTNQSGGGTKYQLTTTNINGPQYIYIALKAPQRTTFTIATGITNMYTFQFTGSLIIQNEEATHQKFTGFNIFEDTSAIVRPDYNDNTNGNVYTIFASTATNHFFKRYEPYSRPKKFKNRPSRVEMDFSIPVANTTFPSGTALDYTIVSADSNMQGNRRVVAYAKENTDEFWISTNKNLPEASTDSKNVYAINDWQVAEQRSLYSLTYENHSPKNNLYWNIKFLTAYKNHVQADIYLQLNLHYETNFKYKMELTRIYKDDKQKGYYYDINFQLGITDKKAIWIG